MAAKKSSKIGLGVGIVTAAALAAAGGYYLSGKNGAKNRKKVKALAARAHREVLARAKKLKAVSKTDYHKIVDMVTKKYAAVKSIDKKELGTVAADLKKHWKRIEAEAKKKNKAIVRKVKKATRR